MEYWLKDLDLNKIQDLSQMLKEEGFKVVPKNVNEFAQKFRPGAWDYKDISVRIYTEDNPIFIYTPGIRDIDHEQYKHIIGMIINTVEAKEIVSSTSRNFDINIFKKAAETYKKKTN